MIDKIINKLLNHIFLAELEINQLVELASEILSKEPNILQINGPTIICGDIHGQYYDLLELFQIGGFPPDSQYLFMGDFVDRGTMSIETICLLLALKIKYPSLFFLSRGNHESRQITQIYGFYDECLKKYSIEMWKTFTDLFDLLPLGAIVEGIFCTHGGLSPSENLIDRFQEIERRREIPYSGTMCDLMWSDPDVGRGFVNSPRGAGYMFGQDVTETFLMKNELNLVCRAHQLMMDGHEFTHNNQCVTIFSAPNYCSRCGNKGSIMEVNKGICEITDYVSVAEEVGLGENTIKEYFI